MRGKICKVKILEMDYAVCSCSTFAMTGALAWQVKNPNKIIIFCFRGRWYGDSFFLKSLALLLAGVSAFFFPLFSLLLVE